MKRRSVAPLVLFLVAVSPVLAQFSSGNPFLDKANEFGEAELLDFGLQLDLDSVVPEGETPARVVIDRAVSFPMRGDTDLIVLRNLGGKTADLRGWVIRDGSRIDIPFTIDEDLCGDVVDLTGGSAVEFRPAAIDNPCGFEFGVSYRDYITVFDANGTLVTEASWQESERGTSFHRMPGGTFKKVREDGNVIELLGELGGYEIFLEALQTLGFDKILTADSDPSYDGPTFPSPPPVEVEPQFPWWFGFSANRSALPPPPSPPPPPPPPVEGIPEKGPYTLMAPNNEAFDALLVGLAGYGNTITKETFFNFPELKDIVLHHIIPGLWTSEYLLNDTSVITAKAIGLTPFNDPPTTEGKLMLHDSCIDKPTPDEYECAEQVEFDKCYDPFMISPLGAQWRGGFCEKSCQRCSCDENRGSFCAEALAVDFYATNGVIHLIDRVLFPPPKFKKEIPKKRPNKSSQKDNRSNLSAGEVRTILKTIPQRSTQG